MCSESIDPAPQEKWPILSWGGRKTFSLGNNGNCFALPKYMFLCSIFPGGGGGTGENLTIFPGGHELWIHCYVRDDCLYI